MILKYSLTSVGCLVRLAPLLRCTGLEMALLRLAQYSSSARKAHQSDIRQSPRRYAFTR
jgi:hypothetical protein